MALVTCKPIKKGRLLKNGTKEVCQKCFNVTLLLRSDISDRYPLTPKTNPTCSHDATMMAVM